MTHVKTFVWGQSKKHVNFASKRRVWGSILYMSLMLEQKDLHILGMFE